MTYLEVRSERQQGKTTALLDIAIANARRGLDVEFWSHSPKMSANAFQIATRLVPAVDAEASVKLSAANGRQSITYPESGGRVRFMATIQHGQSRDAGGDMEIVDGPGDLGTVTRQDTPRPVADRRVG